MLDVKLTPKEKDEFSKIIELFNHDTECIPGKIIVSASNPELLKNKELLSACIEAIKKYNQDRAK